MQTIDIGQALPPPPPPALPPDDGDGASAGDGSTIDSDNDEAQESENGDSVSTPVLVVPPPRSIDGGAERYTTARIAAPTSSSVSVDAVLAPAGQWARVITTELESEDDRPLAQGDANRARTTVVDTSPLLADISNEAMLWNELREVQEALESAFTTPWTFGAIAGLGALSAGYVLWGLQAGSLVTSALSSLPVWGSFDPLPVLEFWERESKRKAQQNSDEDDPLLPSEPRATAV
jgi:hypothetical protein